MSDFLTFRRMITPIIIQVIFWIGVLACVIGAIGVMSDNVLTGLLALILGPVVWRIYCELMILLFRMSETLTDIKNNTEKRSA